MNIKLDIFRNLVLKTVILRCKSVSDRWPTSYLNDVSNINIKISL